MISFHAANALARKANNETHCYTLLIRHLRDRRGAQPALDADFLDSANLVCDCWRARGVTPRPSILPRFRAKPGLRDLPPQPRQGTRQEWYDQPEYQNRWTGTFEDSPENVPF